MKKGWWVVIPLFYAWFVYAASTLSLPSPESPVVFYSSQTRQDLKLLFSRAISSAQNSIFLSVYGITDKDILKKLETKSQEGISIHVEFDPTASCPLHQYLSKAALFPIRRQGLMHRKIVVVDDAQIFLGSANLTTASLRHHDNLIIGLHHKGLADFLKNPKALSFSFSIDDTQQGDLFLLPDPLQQGLNQLIATINQAKDTLRIAMFTLTHPQLTDAIVRAKSRGVDVRVAIDYFTAKGASCKSVQCLYKATIPIFLSQGKQLLHHKWACVDKQNFILGSANWTRSAFTKNQDFLFFLYHLNGQQKKYIDSLWDLIETESQRML